jgi:hypothetical protein
MHAFDVVEINPSSETAVEIRLDPNGTAFGRKATWTSWDEDGEHAGGHSDWHLNVLVYRRSLWKAAGDDFVPCEIHIDDLVDAQRVYGAGTFDLDIPSR